MRIGSQLSPAKGFHKAVAKATELGATAFQYFPKNPKSYRIKAIDRKAAERGRGAAEEADIFTVAHSPYVTNLSTGDAAL